MIVRTASELGLLVRERRKELGLDQQTLATRIGVSRLWVIQFERGKPRAEVGLVLRALLALELHVDVGVEIPTVTGRAPSTSRTATVAPDIDAIVQNSRKPRVPR